MPKTTFIDGDPLQEILGTVVSAAFLNKLNNHHHTGIAADGEGALPYAADSGAADAYVVTLSPALPAYVNGMMLSFKAENANAGASTVNFNGLGDLDIKKNGDTDLVVNDIKANQMVTGIVDGSNFQMISPSGVSKPYDYVCVANEQTSGTAGGTATSGAWRTRVLNTIRHNDNSIASLASDQITLPAGTYECRISCPAGQVNYHKAKLYNITASEDVLIGTSENNSTSGDIIQTPSIIVGSFTIAAESVFEVRHQVQQTKNTNGFGVASSFSVAEVYTVAEFWRIR